MLALLLEEGDGCAYTFVILVGLFFALAIWGSISQHYDKKKEEELAKLPEKKREAVIRQEALQGRYGFISSNMICPHCHTKGTVRTKREKVKQGISGGKATAAILTGGASLIAVGLSQKGETTKAHCDHCGTDWMF